jgi:hypothetical protein
MVATNVFSVIKRNNQHLFFSCPFAKMIWRIVFLSFNMPPPTNITNLFGNWLNGVPKKEKGHIRVGICAMLWAIWRVRNDFIFNKKKFPIIFAGNSFGHSLDPYVVLPTAGGRVSGFGY